MAFEAWARIGPTCGEFRRSITTAGESVFLGHTEPQRLIHDLEVLTKAGR